MRAALSQANLAQCANSGLAYDRYMADIKDEPRQKFLDALAKLLSPPAYQSAFHRYQETLAGLPMAHTLRLRTQSPVAIGLGGPNPIEIGTTFHRTFGVPYIPGTSLKGAMKRVLAHALGLLDPLSKEGYAPDMPFDKIVKKLGIAEDAKPKLRTLLDVFGSLEEASAITVFDGWLVPVANGKPLMIDVMAVHHPKYYQASHNDKNPPPPTDCDDPTPLSFVSIRPGTEFLFAFQCPEEWTAVIGQLLRKTLCDFGIGAKTNTGYGFFEAEARGSGGGESDPGAQAIGEAVRVTVKKQGNSFTVRKPNDYADILLDNPPEALAHGDQIEVRFMATRPVKAVFVKRVGG